MGDTEAQMRGVRGEYAWVNLGDFRDPLARLADEVPELFLGRVLVAVAHDAGPYSISPTEEADGWVMYAGYVGPERGRDEEGWLLPTWIDAIAVSPPIRSMAVVQEFLDVTSSKECYVLDGAADLPVAMFESIEIFSNQCGVPDNVPAQLGADGERGEDDAADRFFHRMVERFWIQMRALKAESYVCVGDGSVILVSRDVQHVERAAVPLWRQDPA